MFSFKIKNIGVNIMKFTPIPNKKVQYLYIFYNLLFLYTPDVVTEVHAMRSRVYHEVPCLVVQSHRS